MRSDNMSWHVCACRDRIATVQHSPETNSSPGSVPYRAPDKRLRLSVPGTANVCMKMYTMQYPMVTCTWRIALGYRRNGGKCILH